MSKLVTVAKKQIALINNELIRTLILAELKEDADTLHQLFCLKRKPRFKKFSLSPKESLIRIEARDFMAIVFAYAPNSLCHKISTLLLQLEPEQAVSILESKKNYLNSTFRIILKSTHPTIRDNICTWLETLSAEHIQHLLVNNNLIDLVKKDRPYSFALIRAVNKLPPDLLIPLFKKSHRRVYGLARILAGFSGHDGLVRLFASKKIPESTALAFLGCIEKLNNEELLMLFRGGAIKKSHSRDAPNLFHHILQYHSAPVVIKALELSERFTVEQQEFLLSFCYHQELNSWCCTPLDYAFSSNSGNVARAIINNLQNKPFFHSLLLSSAENTSGYSPLDIAARSQNTELVAYCLQQEFHQSHYDSALKLAKKHNKYKIINLIEAYPLYLTILNKTGQDYETMKTQLEAFTNDPELLSSIGLIKWHNKERFLHLATQHRNKAAVEFLLQHSFVLNFDDINCKTPLDHALESNQLELASLLLTMPHIKLHDLDTEKNSDVRKILETHHYDLILQAITKLSTRITESPVLLCYAATLDRLPDSPKYYDELNELLVNIDPAYSIQDLLLNYCQSHQDGITHFLIEIGRILSLVHHSGLATAYLNFVQNRLALAANVSNPENEREQARNQVFIILFSLSLERMLPLLKQLTLSREQKEELETVLCYALVRPGIFSRLTVIQHRDFYNYLDIHSEALLRIIGIHFQQTDLSLIPRNILLLFTNILTSNQIVYYSQNRRNATLLMLCLRKMFKQRIQDEAQINCLFEQLQEELELFNQTESPLRQSDLLQLLNLAVGEKIHSMLWHYLASQAKEAPIHQRLRALFTDYANKYNLVKDCFLEQYFLNQASDIQLIAEPLNRTASINLFARANPEVFLELFTHYENMLAGALINNSLAPTTNLATADCLKHWINRLSLQIDRVSLKTYIDLIEKSHQQINHNIQLLASREEPQLTNELQHLNIELKRLVHRLIRDQTRLEQPLYSEDLNRQLEILKEAYIRTAARLNNPQTRKLINPKKSYLSSLQWSEIGEHLPDSLICHYQILDQKEEDRRAQNLNQNIELTSPCSSSSTINIKEIITPPILTDELAMALSQINHCFLDGILANSNRSTLLKPLFGWMLRHTQSQEDKLYFLTKIPELLGRINQRDWHPIDSLLKKQLKLQHRAQTLLTELRLLTFAEEIRYEDLILCLYNMELPALSSFINLCKQIPQEGLLKLTQAIIVGKTEAIPVEYWVLNNPEINISEWLNRALEQIDDYCSQLSSLMILKDSVYFKGCNPLDRLNRFNEQLDEDQVIITEQALLLFIESYQPLLNADLLSSESLCFITTLVAMMKKANLTTEIKVLNAMPNETVKRLIGHCLSGMTNPNDQRASACHYLLNCLTKMGATANESNFSIIKQQLGAQDLAVLEDPLLIKMAESILSKEDSSLFDSTLSGVWIQRLICSPQFVAASKPQALAQLIERYRLICLTLKQDEFDCLNAHLNYNQTSKEQNQETLITLEARSSQKPLVTTQLLAKRQSLLKFRADDAIRALFNRLEQRCNLMRKEDAATANKALENLYTHYNKRLLSLRSDNLFKLSNFIHSRATENKGDLENAKSGLLGWLKQYLPHENFEQTELSRKQRASIYDATGKKIGYIDEAQNAWSYGERTSLLESKGAMPGMVLYDSKRRRMGTLMANSSVALENLFQHQTSARLIARVPQDQLQQSPMAVELLIQDLFIEKTISSLYQQQEIQSDDEKRRWLEQEISRHLCHSKRPISHETIEAIIAHHDDDSVLQLLSASKQTCNGKAVLRAILADQNKRPILFERGEEAFASFLNQQDSSAVLADYLLMQREKPWFAQGLALFAPKVQQFGQSNLLLTALAHLAKQIAAHKISEKDFQAVILNLINHELTARLVLEHFLLADRSSSIQGMQSARIKRFTSLLGKSQLLPLIESLNNEMNWRGSARYQLILLALEAYQTKLMKGKELRFSLQQAWQAGELKLLTSFVIKHLKNQHNQDEGLAIGHHLLGELTIRNANFGHLDLFYNAQGELDRFISNGKLKRSLLQQIASQFYLPTAVKKALKTVEDCFVLGTRQKEERHIRFLEENNGIANWDGMSKAAWLLSDNGELPLIWAYLMHYSGPAAPLEKLIRHYVSASDPQTSRDSLCHLSHLMSAIPNRDIAQLIFTTTHKIIVKKPDLLSANLLKDLSSFYHGKYLTMDQPMNTMRSQLGLINYFGQQKQYKLVIQACTILIEQGTTDRLLIDTLKRIRVEARVEQELTPRLGRWHFALMRFFKRAWNYSKTPTDHVRFCDDHSSYNNPVTPLPTIKTPVMGGQQIEAQLQLYDVTNKAKALYVRAETILRAKPKMDRIIRQNSQGTIGLFKTNTELAGEIAFSASSSSTARLGGKLLKDVGAKVEETEIVKSPPSAHR